MIVLFALWAALWNRLRGGLIGKFGISVGTQTARAMWGAALALPATLVALDWRLLALAGTFWAGYAVIGWLGGMDMGRRDGRWWTDALAMLLCGSLRTAPSAALLWWLGYDLWYVLAGAGALCPVTYEIGWRVPTLGTEFEQGPPIAELCFGAVIGTALCIVIAF